jgi:ferredoxin
MNTCADTRPLRHWLHRADSPHLVLCCVEHPDPTGWSRVVRAGRVPAATPTAPAGFAGPDQEHAVVQLGTCIGEASPAVLLELVAGGASGITVALDGCANPGVAEAVVARAGRFLSALGRPETTEAASWRPPDRKRGAAWPILGEGAVPVSRRALFGRPDGLDLDEPSEHPTQRLAAVLRELDDGAGSRTVLDGIPTGVPRLTATRCAGSGLCARSCPADALTLTRTVLAEARAGQDGMSQFQLTFDPDRCTDCGQCLQVCPESALHRSGEYLWSSLPAGEQVALRVGLIRPCTRCGMSNGRSGDLCAVCGYRATNPFGSRMPPGLPVRMADRALLEPPSGQ